MRRGLLLVELCEVLPVAGIGLCDARGVLDQDVRAPEADEGEGHRHAVVVVGVEKNWKK